MPIDYNLLAGMGRSAAASHQAGLNTGLAIERVARDRMTRNALTGYLEAAPEQRDARLNALVAESPEAAANVLAIETARNDRALLERQRHAQEALLELRAIKSSANPGLAFRLMAERPDEGNPLRGLIDQLSSQGVINLEDGISDEEAATISDLAITQLTPVAGLADDERAAPAAIREMQALGYELTPEGFAQYNADRGSDTGSPADQLAAIQAQLAIDARRDQLERDRRAEEERVAEQTRQRTTLRNTVRRSITQTGKIAELVGKLEGSFLEAGMPASSWRRTGASALAGIGGALGMDTEELTKDVQAFDELKKNLSDQLINLLSTGGLGEATNSKLEQYQNALASTETSPGAILAIQANIAQTLLDEADTQGFEIFDRGKVEANIEKWHEYDAPAPEVVVDAPAAAAAIQNIGRMTLEELGSIDAKGMTAEMLEAAAQRWDELNAAAAEK